MRVLLVGPFEQWASVTRDNIEVHQVANATEALDALTTFYPTVVLVDPSAISDQRESLIRQAEATGCLVVASRPGIGVAIPGSTLQDLEKHAILETLKAVGGGTSKAAKMLGISVRKIQYRLKDWGLRSGQLGAQQENGTSALH
jgi:transcriptional regulator with GAF, ATPase, and Fis domain